MINVLHIAPGIDGGGVGGVIYNYLSHMNLKDMHIEIIVRDYGHRQFLHDKFEKLGIPVHYIIQRKENPKKHFDEIGKIMRDGRFDVVHCHDQNWSVIYLKMAEKIGVPVRIAHSHLTVQTSDRIKVAISNLFTASLKKTATGYFACGKAAGAYMWGNEIANCSKLYVMRNAVDAQAFQFNKNIRTEFRKNFGFENRTIIGHIGRFNEQKNHLFLIEIFKAYLALDPTAILVLIGIGELEPKIRNLVNRSEIQNNVIFLGQRNDVRELYNAFDVFLLPSLYEGLPVVGIEAQANGLPCLFSDTISDEVVILPGTKVLKLSDSAQIWADTIRELVNKKTIDRAKAIDVINADGYNIEVEAEKLRKYYFAEVTERKRK